MKPPALPQRRPSRDIRLHTPRLLSGLPGTRIPRRYGRWVARDDLSRIPVPLTLEALISSRLDLLDEAQRTVMESASIEGKTFHRDAVQVLSPADSRSDVEAALESLTDKELIGPLVSEGPGVYAFHHLLIRDVVYRSIPKRRRAELHEAFAALLTRAARRPVPIHPFHGPSIAGHNKCRAPAR